MNDPFINRVLALANVQKPVEQPNQQHWDTLEKKLEIELPSDFKELVTKLGNGHFGEFWLLNPCSSWKANVFSYGEVLNFHRLVGWIAKEAGFPLHPEDGGFIKIGVSGNRTNLLVRPEPSLVPPYTLVWLDQDYRAAHYLKITISQFIHDLYCDQIQDDWAREVRSLIWGPSEPFFLPPGHFDMSAYDS